MKRCSITSSRKSVMPYSTKKGNLVQQNSANYSKNGMTLNARISITAAQVTANSKNICAAISIGAKTPGETSTSGL